MICPEGGGISYNGLVLQRDALPKMGTTNFLMLEVYDCI